MFVEESTFNASSVCVHELDLKKLSSLLSLSHVLGCNSSLDHPIASKCVKCFNWHEVATGKVIREACLWSSCWSRHNESWLFTLDLSSMSSRWSSLCSFNWLRWLLRDLNSFIDFNPLWVRDELCEIFRSSDLGVQAIIDNRNWILNDEKDLPVHNGLLEVLKSNNIKVLWFFCLIPSRI